MPGRIPHRVRAIRSALVPAGVRRWGLPDHTPCSIVAARSTLVLDNAIRVV